MSNIEKYLGMDQAREVLANLGIVLSDRQMRRAAEPDAHGKRKLPFFKDPITNRLVIAETTLKQVYQTAQDKALHGKNTG